MTVMRDYHPITAILEMPSPHTRGAYAISKNFGKNSCPFPIKGLRFP